MTIDRTTNTALLLTMLESLALHSVSDPTTRQVDLALRLLPQFRILLWRKLQPDTASTPSDRLSNLPAPGDIQHKAAEFGHLPIFL